MTAASLEARPPVYRCQQLWPLGLPMDTSKFEKFSQEQRDAVGKETG
ncbi:MAG: hypothetical protein ACLTBV_30000 [Enterocloster bolteae]